MNKIDTGSVASGELRIFEARKMSTEEPQQKMYN